MKRRGYGATVTPFSLSAPPVPDTIPNTLYKIGGMENHAEGQGEGVRSEREMGGDP
jgi:hypothetical protein